MKTQNKTKKFILLTALLGLLAWAGPKLLIEYLSHRFPALASIEETHEISGLIVHILMVSIGLLMGYLQPAVKIWLWGIAGIISIPFYTFIEIGIDPYSHNLWPLEFIFTYPYFAGLIIAGALLGKVINKKISGKKIENKTI